MIATNEPPSQGEATGSQAIQAGVQTRRFNQSDSPILPKIGLSYARIRELRKDPTIGLVRKLIPGPILAANWSIEGKDENTPQEWVDFIKENMEPIRDSFLTTTLKALLDFGWMPYEKVFQQNEETGALHLTKLKPLLQDFTYVVVNQDTGAFDGFFQPDYLRNSYHTPYSPYYRSSRLQYLRPELDLTKGVYIPRSKAFLLSAEVEGTNWYGESRFCWAESPIQDWKDANAGAKRYDAKVAGSHWVVYYPSPGSSEWNGVLTDNKIIAEAILDTLEASGGIVIPNAVNRFVQDMNEKDQGWKIDVLSDVNARQYSFIARLQYLDKLKVRAFGFPERALLEGNFGTKAESGVHANIAATAQDVDHRYLVNELNTENVDQLLFLNFGEEAVGQVRVKPAPITDASITFLQTAYRQMINNADVAATEHNELDMKEYRNKIGIPTNDLAEEVPILTSGQRELLSSDSNIENTRNTDSNDTNSNNTDSTENTDA